MYTVEINATNSVITSLDDADAYDDVVMKISDDGSVFIEQHIQDVDEVNTIYLSYQQLTELFAGLQTPEGAYSISMIGVH